MHQDWVTAVLPLLGGHVLQAEVVIKQNLVSVCTVETMPSQSRMGCMHTHTHAFILWNQQDLSCIS